MAKFDTLRQREFEERRRKWKEENRTPWWVWAAIAGFTVSQILVVTYVTPLFL